MRQDRKKPGGARATAEPTKPKPLKRCVYCGRTEDEANELFLAESGYICAKCIYRIAQQIKADCKRNQKEKQ